jgi:hypothetical protein
MPDCPGKDDKEKPWAACDELQHLVYDLDAEDCVSSSSKSMSNNLTCADFLPFDCGTFGFNNGNCISGEGSS